VGRCLAHDPVAEPNQDPPKARPRRERRPARQPDGSPLVCAPPCICHPFVRHQQRRVFVDVHAHTSRLASCARGLFGAPSFSSGYASPRREARNPLKPPQACRTTVSPPGERGAFEPPRAVPLRHQDDPEGIRLRAVKSGKHVARHCENPSNHDDLLNGTAIWIRHGPQAASSPPARRRLQAFRQWHP